MIRERKVFPCYFGSALKLQGVEELLKGLERWMTPPVYGKEFGAKVYKISRDDQGNRLTHLKITGGTLKVKDVIAVLQEWKREKRLIRFASIPVQKRRWFRRRRPE